MFLGKSIKIHPLISGLKRASISAYMSYGLLVALAPLPPLAFGSASTVSFALASSNYSKSSFSFTKLFLISVSFSSFDLVGVENVNFNFSVNKLTIRLSSETIEIISASFPGRDSELPDAYWIYKSNLPAISLY